MEDESKGAEKKEGCCSGSGRKCGGCRFLAGLLVGLLLAGAGLGLFVAGHAGGRCFAGPHCAMQAPAPGH